MVIVFKLIILAGLFTLILYPFFRKSAQPQLTEGSGDRHQLLLQEKDTLYAAIKDLDFDYHKGKLSQADYQNLRANNQQQAVELLKRLEETGTSQLPKAEKKGGRR